MDEAFLQRPRMGGLKVVRHSTIISALSASLVVVAQSREIVPGVVSFDEPPGLVGFGPQHDPGDNPFNLSQTVIQYQPGHDGRASFRQFDIGIGVVGFEFGNGKRVTFHKLSEDDLKKELSGYPPFREATNQPSVQETSVSGRKAYFFTTRVPAPSQRKDAVIWREFYYVPFEPNRGVTLSLVTDDERELGELRALLKRITIPADAHFIKPPPPSDPTPAEKMRAQIISNLRMIVGAGQQCQLRHGQNRFTLAELRKDFGQELAALNSVNGENYEALVWEDGKALRVSTQTLGEIAYGP